MTDYQILGVSENATDEELKTALRNLQKKFHPDVNIGNEKVAKEKFQEVVEAYQNIKKNRTTQTGNTATPNQTSNEDWFSKMNEFNRKIKEFQGKEDKIKNQQTESEKDLASAKSTLYDAGIKRNHYYGEIRISLIHLLSQINQYYYSKIEEINRSIL